jgi:hypothetical protein
MGIIASINEDRFGLPCRIIVLTTQPQPSATGSIDRVLNVPLHARHHHAVTFTQRQPLNPYFSYSRDEGRHRKRCPFPSRIFLLGVYEALWLFTELDVGLITSLSELNCFLCLLALALADLVSLGYLLDYTASVVFCQHTVQNYKRYRDDCSNDGTANVGS